MNRKRTVLAVASLLLASVAAIQADTLPDDRRLQPLKDLNGYFPFSPPRSKADWDKRADYVRRQLLVSQGLWPMPTKLPLNAVLHSQIVRADYTVENVYFESAPGFFVTGNLYRPKGVKGKVPGVLFTHGHWQDARLSEETEAKLRNEIATGQERFEQRGKTQPLSIDVRAALRADGLASYGTMGHAQRL